MRLFHQRNDTVTALWGRRQGPPRGDALLSVASLILFLESLVPPLTLPHLPVSRLLMGMTSGFTALPRA